MVNQRHCPYCGVAAKEACDHLALAVPGKDFVRRCIDAAQAHRQWEALCRTMQKQAGMGGEARLDRWDFTWLETAFSDRFLKPLRWFGGIDHEWRTGERLDRGGFYVLLWSKSPQRLWWELTDEIERQSESITSQPLPHPGLFSFDNRQMTFHGRARL